MNKVVFIEKTGEGEYEFSCSPEEFFSLWHDYFDLGTDYDYFRSKVPSNDSFLQEAIKVGGGIRILKQDPWEMLITFIISQRKNIPAIIKAVETLSQLCGTPIKSSDGQILAYGFPSPEALSRLSLEDLTACSLGYRAKYIYQATRAVVSGEFSLEAGREMSDEQLKTHLLKVTGVGEKVANCVMLFGFYRIGAFPVDVWIDRVISNEYNGNFPLELYQGFAGVIQQYMFYYGRIKG